MFSEDNVELSFLVFGLGHPRDLFVTTPGQSYTPLEVWFGTDSIISVGVMHRSDY